jgi:hypothetical protein
MGIKVLLMGAFFAVANVSSVYACDGCGCRGNASVDHEHADEGYVKADMEYGFAEGQSESLAQCAIEMFGNLEGKRVELTAKAEGGCDYSKKSLRAEEIKSIKEMLKALGNSDSRRLLALGMMMSANDEVEKAVIGENPISDDDGGMQVTGMDEDSDYESVLTDAEEVLEARLEMIMAVEVQ